MNEEKPRVTHRAEGLKTQAAGLLSRRPRHLAQRLFHGTLFALPRMQPYKHVLLHTASISRATVSSVWTSSLRSRSRGTGPFALRPFPPLTYSLPRVFRFSTILYNI